MHKAWQRVPLARPRRGVFAARSISLDERGQSRRGLVDQPPVPELYAHKVAIAHDMVGQARADLEVEVGEDLIDVSALGVEDIGDLSIRDMACGTLVRSKFGVAKLVDVDADDLSETDFVFVDALLT